MSENMEMEDPPGEHSCDEKSESESESQGAGVSGDTVWLMEAETFQNLLTPLLSCGVCDKIIVDPVTLQCGNSLCRNCLPGSVEVSSICETGQGAPAASHPHFWTIGSPYRAANVDSTKGKYISPTIRERFDCPFECPRKQHAREVKSNYILQKILAVIHAPLSDKTIHSETTIDLRSRINSELDCQICYFLLYDPLTTPCGHTFCRSCLLRTSDHAAHPVCPTCRSPVLLPTVQNTPTNKLLDTLIRTIFPIAVAERAASENTNTLPLSSGCHTPIFVCTLALPSVTCFLHIFEPRYRLMLRRCMSADRRFGMVLPRSRVTGRWNNEIQEMNYIQPEQGIIPPGTPTFMKYGTMLEIREMQMLPDGRSLVETIGRERFQIQDWSVLDGYIVAKTLGFPDMEPCVYYTPEDVSLTTSLLTSTSPDLIATNDLIYLTRLFVQSLRSVPWLSARLRDNELDEQLARLESGGDAVKFAWWVGSKMPMEEGEAYKLLLQGSVRELYCVLGGWIGEMERQSWYSPARGCRIS